MPLGLGCMGQLCRDVRPGTSEGGSLLEFMSASSEGFASRSTTVLPMPAAPSAADDWLAGPTS